MNKVIRRLKKIMGFDKDPELTEAPKPKLKKPKKAVEEVQETEIEKLERELEELKKEEAILEEPLEELEQIEEKVEEKKSPTLNEILHSHEQRILQMEAKWFRLGGI